MTKIFCDRCGKEITAGLYGNMQIYGYDTAYAEPMTRGVSRLFTLCADCFEELHIFLLPEQERFKQCMKLIQQTITDKLIF